MPRQFTTLAMSHTIKEELDAAGGLPDEAGVEE